MSHLTSHHWNTVLALSTFGAAGFGVLSHKSEPINSQPNQQSTSQQSQQSQQELHSSSDNETPTHSGWGSMQHQQHIHNKQRRT